MRPGVLGGANWSFLLTIASWNVEESVRPILEGFGLWDYFSKKSKSNIIQQDRHDKDDHPRVDFVHMWMDAKSFEELRELLEKLG